MIGILVVDLAFRTLVEVGAVEVNNAFEALAIFSSLKEICFN